MWWIGCPFSREREIATYILHRYSVLWRQSCRGLLEAVIGCLNQQGDVSLWPIHVRVFTCLKLETPSRRGQPGIQGKCAGSSSLASPLSPAKWFSTSLSVLSLFRHGITKQVQGTSSSRLMWANKLATYVLNFFTVVHLKCNNVWP